MHPPVELGDAAFPDIAVSFDSDKEYDNKVGYHHGVGKTEAQDDDVVLVRVRTASTDIPATVAAAAAASADAPEADMDICFCCCDSLAMELVCLTCCKKTIHHQCLLAYLGTNSQCCYSHCPVDMAKVMGYEMIDRSLPKPLTPVKTPKRDLQQMLMNEKTPLRDADQVHSQ
jgi:hypothetical protein